MTEQNGQPKPARPAADAGPAWLRYRSQMTDAELRALLSARDKATTATPGLQSALTIAVVVAVLATVMALAIFNFSHFRAMDGRYGRDSAGNRTGGFVDDTTSWGIALLALAGAGSAAAGVRLDVTARTRAILMLTGAAVLIVIGTGVGLLLDPSRQDFLRHFHVGVWGTRASFDRLMHVLGASGWLVAVCGVTVVVLMVVQRRRLVAAYPD